MRRAVKHGTGVLLAMIAVLAVAPANTLARSYVAAKELGAKEARSKNPDGAWSRMYGEADDPATYNLMSVYLNEPFFESACGVKDDSSWDGSAAYLPAVGYYAGKTLTPGQDACAPDITIKKNTLWMIPEATSGGANAAILAWTASTSGTVTVSGSVQTIESGLTGITWQVDHNATVLAGPVAMTTDTTKKFKSLTVDVLAGESIDLEIAHINPDGYSDTVAVKMTVTEG
jgi:hypothetical protein